MDWYYNDANINTIEFVYKHVESTNEQLILVSKAQEILDQRNWDLRVVPSSDGASSSFAFRLNNSQTGSLAIASNALSMSTDFSSVRDGQLWNVMLQRMTASSDSTITNEYRLHVALQENTKIKTYNYVTMSVNGSGGVANSNANKNFIGTGSRGPTIAENLLVGGNGTVTNPNGLTGSLAEIKAWSTPLSTSKFRQHTFNKFSTVGNSINSHKDELIYHFKLNENYTTASISSSVQTVKIVDSSPTTTYSNYSIESTDALKADFTGSLVYGFDNIDVIKLTLKDNSDVRNDNNILINPNHRVVGNLSPNKQALESLTNPLGKKPQFKTSPKLELYRSPQTYVDNFILDKITGFNLETLYGNPMNYYSQSYDEFVTFRENFFDAHPITVDVNKFIRAHENMFNDSIVEGLKQVVPARSTFSDKNSKFGVEIKQNILEKQKYVHHKHSVETNPNTFTSSISPSPNLSNSEFIQPKSGSADVSVTSVSTYEQPKSASINVNVTNTTTYERPKSGSINSLPSLNNSTYEASKNGTIDYASRANESYSDVHKNWGTSSADVQHINFAGGTGSYGTFNTYDIETRFVFHTIGDSEYYSASKGNPSDFTNINNFYNHLQITDGPAKNVFYTHLMSVNRVLHTAHEAGKDNTFNGKRMGKTRFMREVANADNIFKNFQLILPRNHVTKFSNPFKDRMYEGTQNITSGSISAGFLNVQHEDYSSASFYSVKVTGGENQIYVKGLNNPTKGGDDKIIY